MSVEQYKMNILANQMGQASPSRDKEVFDELRYFVDNHETFKEKDGALVVDLKDLYGDWEQELAKVKSKKLPYKGKVYEMTVNDDGTIVFGKSRYPDMSITEFRYLLKNYMNFLFKDQDEAEGAAKKKKEEEDKAKREEEGRKEKEEARKAIENLTANDDQIAWYAKSGSEIHDIIDKRLKDGLAAGKSYEQLLGSIAWAVDYLNDFGYGSGKEKAQEVIFDILEDVRKRDKGDKAKLEYYKALEDYWQSFVQTDKLDYAQTNYEMAVAFKGRYDRRKEVEARAKAGAKARTEDAAAKAAAKGIPKGKANAIVLTWKEIKEKLPSASGNYPDNKRFSIYMARTLYHMTPVKD